MIQAITKEDFILHKDKRGFVFRGNYTQRGVEHLIKVLKVHITDSEPEHIFLIDGCLVFVWNGVCKFDGPPFFERAAMISNMHVNSINMGSLFSIGTIREFIN